MTTSLSDIRFLVEREVGESVVPEDILNWCNQVNMDVGGSINVPSTTPLTITLLSTTFQYALPTDLKLINLLRLQSDIDNKIDRPLDIKYRIYNQFIIFPIAFYTLPDTLVVDYYKHMKYFSDISDNIDIDDRFTPIYVFYCKLNFHNQRKEPQNVSWRVAINSINTLTSNYNNMKRQVISYYSLRNEPVTIEERW